MFLANQNDPWSGPWRTSRRRRSTGISTAIGQIKSLIISNHMDFLFKRQPVLRRIKRPNLVYLWLQCNSITRKASSTSGCSNTCFKNWSILVVNTFRSSGSCADELPPTLVPLLHIPLVIPPPNKQTDISYTTIISDIYFKFLRLTGWSSYNWLISE